MVLFHHIAHHGRGFAVRAVGPQPRFEHPKQDAALYGFQPVADVRQRPADDDGHGVIEVGGLHLLLNRLGNDARFVGQRHLRHLKKDGPAFPLQISRLRTSRAYFTIKSRRGSTSSPISLVKISSASTASSTSTRSSVRVAGFMVVSHSWSGFISPSPLYRCTSGLTPFPSNSLLPTCRSSS